MADAPFTTPEAGLDEIVAAICRYAAARGILATEVGQLVICG
jgi:hypothetical protein